MATEKTLSTRYRVVKHIADGWYWVHYSRKIERTSKKYVFFGGPVVRIYIERWRMAAGNGLIGFISEGSATAYMEQLKTGLSPEAAQYDIEKY